MATTVQDFGISNERTEFSGSSEDDIQHAKTFWQSVQLLPPMESRLVSSHVSQRLKVAPPGHQPINITYKGIEEPPQLKEFFAKAHVMQEADRSEKIVNLNKMKEQHKQLFNNQREARKEKEKISKGKGISRLDPLPLPIDQDEEIETAEDLRKQTFDDIAAFEQKLGHGDFERDSDSD